MFEKLVQFFQTRLVKINAQPEIKIDFHDWHRPEIEDALKKMWEALFKELKQNPSSIKKREWQTVYSNEDRYETVTINIDGVTLQLSGPHYPNPDYHPKRERYVPELSVQQRADKHLDELIQGNSLVWALTNASRVKVVTLLAVLRSAVGETIVDPKVVNEAVEKVLQLLSIAETRKVK